MGILKQKPLHFHLCAEWSGLFVHINQAQGLLKSYQGMFDDNDSYDNSYDDGRVYFLKFLEF